MYNRFLKAALLIVTLSLLGCAIPKSQIYPISLNPENTNLCTITFVKDASAVGFLLKVFVLDENPTVKSNCFYAYNYDAYQQSIAKPNYGAQTTCNLYLDPSLKEEEIQYSFYIPSADDISSTVKLLYVCNHPWGPIHIDKGIYKIDPEPGSIFQAEKYFKVCDILKDDQISTIEKFELTKKQYINADKIRISAYMGSENQSINVRGYSNANKIRISTSSRIVPSQYMGKEDIYSCQTSSIKEDYFFSPPILIQFMEAVAVGYFVNYGSVEWKRPAGPGRIIVIHTGAGQPSRILFSQQFDFKSGKHYVIPYNSRSPSGVFTISEQ